MKYESVKVNKKSSVNKDFREEFRAVVPAHGIPEAKAEWYVKRARKFAVSMRGVPLKAPVNQKYIQI